MSKYIKSLFNSNYLFKVLFEQLNVLKKKDNYFFKEIKYKLFCSLLNPDFFDKNDFEKINNDILKFILENKNDREIFSKTFFEQIIKFDLFFSDEKTKNNFNEVLKLIINNLPKSEVEELKSLIDSNPQAQLEWDLCVELERSNPLLDLVGAELGLTPTDIDNIFRYANGEIPNIEREGNDE